MMVEVQSWQEEWRTSTLRTQWPMGGRARVSYGRVCLWLRLACGHCKQRMAPLDRGGNFRAPKRARCSDCDP